MASRTRVSKQAKHIDLKHILIQQLVNSSMIQMIKLSARHNDADSSIDQQECPEQTSVQRRPFRHTAIEPSKSNSRAHHPVSVHAQHAIPTSAGSRCVSQHDFSFPSSQKELANDAHALWHTCAPKWRSLFAWLRRRWNFTGTSLKNGC